MKNLFKTKWLVLATIVAMTFVFIGCGGDDGSEDPIWTNHQNYSIQLRNHSKYDLVAFADEVSQATILGGVKGPTSGGWGLKPNSTYFGASPKVFRMVFILREDYEANKTKLSSASNKVITSMFIYWNGNAGSNDKVYEISADMGSGYKFEVMNPTNFNVELRTIGPAGPTLGYAPKGLGNVVFNTSEMEIVVYPVFIFENTGRQIIETVYPMYTTGNLAGQPTRVPINLEGETGIASISIGSFLSGMKRSTGVAYLKVYNNLDAQLGDIAFQIGTTIQTTPQGTRYFSAANSPREFRFEMEKLDTNAYGASRPSGALNVIIGGNVPVPVTAVHDSNIRSFTLLNDTTYQVIVKSDGNLNVTATLEARPPRDVPNNPDNPDEGSTLTPYENGPEEISLSLTGF